MSHRKGRIVQWQPRKLQKRRRKSQPRKPAKRSNNRSSGKTKGGSVKALPLLVFSEGCCRSGDAIVLSSGWI